MQQNRDKALFIAQKLFAELVFDTQKLEGLPFTLPEVQTYIQGVTVGGHKIADEEKLKQQIRGWERLVELVRTDLFTVNKEIACELQAIIAKDEALELGWFRSGQVGIAGTEYAPPPAAELEARFVAMLEDVAGLDDARDQACRVHLDCARNQFFYDGNKRTGLLLANGHLLTHGYPPLSIPAKRLADYNSAMLRFYESGDYAEMTAFLRDCHESMWRRFA